MKALPLIAWLALSSAQAQTAPAADPGLQAPAAAEILPPLAGRPELLKDIDGWHALLPVTTPPNPLTEKFGPDLDLIQASAKHAKTAADLKQSRLDFKTWQHEYVLDSYRRARGEGVATGNLNDFSERQRALVLAFEQQRAQMLVPNVHRLDLTRADGNLAFDNSATAAAVTAGPVATAPGAVSPGPGGIPSTLPPNPGALVNAQTPAYRLDGDAAVAAAAPPPVTSAALSFQSIEDYIDTTRGGRIAHAIATEAVGFTHWCFAYVKEAFIKAKDELWAKISSPTESGEIGIPPGIAADYQIAVNRNPQLLAKLGYRRVDPKTIPGQDPSIVPEGTVFDFAQGCAGYSAGAGHIEIAAARSRLSEIRRSARPALSADEVLACSDGCHGRTLNYYRTYGGVRRVGRRFRPACMSMYIPVSNAPTTLASNL